MFKKYLLLFHIAIITAISLLFLFPIFKGFYASHDSVTHVARTAAYAKAFLSGQFPPRWAQDLNFGYGSPFLIFYYPLPGYIMAGLSLMGVPLEITYRLFAGVIFLLGPIIFYVWTRQKFSPFISLVATIFYISLPYRFLTLYVRGGIGEFLAFSLTPALFLILQKGKNKEFTILLLALTSGLLVLSHNAIGLLFLPVFLLYAFLEGKSQFFTAVIGVGVGLLLSAYFWIPALVEAKYTSPLFYFKDWYKDHFVSPLSLIYSPWGFGPDINKPGGLSAQLGIAGSVVLAYSIFLLTIKHKVNPKKLILFWLLIAFVGLFLSTSLSSFLWLNIDFLKKFQFPWRFMVLPAFAAAALCPYTISSIKREWILISIATLCVVFSLPYIGVPKYVTYPQSFYYNYTGSTYYHGEATTPWTEGDPGRKAKAQFQIINGDNVLLSPVKQATLHVVETNSSTPVTLIDNTVYFPGWTAYVDNREVPIQFQDINYKGFIEINIPAGKHAVAIRFEETKIRKIGDMVSLLGIGAVIAFIVFLSGQQVLVLFIKKIKKKSS